jgi:hypothetical protein
MQNVKDQYPIERCPKCRQRNRILPHSLRYKPVCRICRTDLPDPYRIGTETWLFENDIPVQRLSFELLPPGTWNINDVIRHYDREARYFPFDLQGRELQLFRLLKIKSIDPSECYVGTELWLGYCVFTFKYSTKVVLECPVEGNATYVLDGNWKPMVRYSKKYLRNKYPSRYIKIVHKGDWLNRIIQALR